MATTYATAQTHNTNSIFIAQSVISKSSVSIKILSVQRLSVVSSWLVRLTSQSRTSTCRAHPCYLKFCRKTTTLKNVLHVTCVAVEPGRNLSLEQQATTEMPQYQLYIQRTIYRVQLETIGKEQQKTDMF